MLTRRQAAPPFRAAPRRRQAGVVLMMALIVLVAMTLAGIALVRSVDTTNIIAGNLAYQQAATNSSDFGTAAAVTWLQNNNGATLQQSVFAQGYAANFQPTPAPGQSWDNYWNTVLVPGGQVVSLAPDAAGNAVSYAIQRLCNAVGDPASPGTGCAVVPALTGIATSSSKTSGSVPLHYSSQIYYRVTSRVAGPRNTVSYVQTIVAL
ncbi:MAG TPA: hypothetical protein VMV33_06650 [Rhodocyclaceae bacterium]|nr:hypothetical protein [Rhodocyclaceae bacterium]